MITGLHFSNINPYAISVFLLKSKRALPNPALAWQAFNYWVVHGPWVLFFHLYSVKTNKIILIGFVWF